jgi:hypothetical protein
VKAHRARPATGTGADPAPIPLYKALLDANVLHSAFVTDVMLRLAAEDLFLPLWTLRIHDEWLRNLALKRPDLGYDRLQVRRDRMLGAFPHALVPPSRGLKLLFPNVSAKDRHVAAAARNGRATHVVTFNVRDFPDRDLSTYGITVHTPDEFLCGLAGEMPNHVCTTLMKKHRAVLARPRLSQSQYIQALIRNGLERFANLIGD